MIPRLNIVAWSRAVPWPEPRQVEQDLIICRTIIEVFSDPVLCSKLRLRGGTALNKLHFPTPLRYSEDIDLVRTTTGPIGPILDRLRAVLEPWLGRASFRPSRVAPKLRFRARAEDDSAAIIRLRPRQALTTPLQRLRAEATQACAICPVSAHLGRSSGISDLK